jgi:hypothetical protein
MAITHTQAQLDERASLVRAAVVTYHRIHKSMKESIGDLPDHRSRTDNPHQLINASIGLSHVENHSIAAPGEVASGLLNTRYTTPFGLASLLTQADSLQSAEGYRKHSVEPTGGVWVVDATRAAVQHVALVEDLSVTLPAAPMDRQRTLTLLVQQGPIAYDIAFTNAIKWRANDSDLGWGTWSDEITYETTEAQALVKVLEYNEGSSDTVNTQWRSDPPYQTAEGWLVPAQTRQRSIGFSASKPNHTYKFVFTQTPVGVLGRCEDLGKVVCNDEAAHPNSLSPDAVGEDTALAQGTPRLGYVGVLDSSIDFTQAVVSAAPLTRGTPAATAGITWERVMHRGEAVYLPSAPLWSGVSYDHLLEVGCVDGRAVITIPLGGDRYVSFALSLLSGTSDTDVQTLTTTQTQGSDWDRLMYAFITDVDPGLREASFSLRPASQWGLGGTVGSLQWTRDLYSVNPTHACVRGHTDVTKHHRAQWMNRSTEDARMGWRPALVPLYETTLA